MKKASLLIILILAVGCEDQNANDLKLSIPNPNTANYNKELVKEFEEFLSNYKQSIEEVLLNYGITPKPVLDQTDWIKINVFDWRINKKLNEICSALVLLTGRKLFNQSYELPIMVRLNFQKIDSTWHLILANGYLDGNSDDEYTLDVPPEFHISMKDLFPHTIEVDELRRLMRKNREIQTQPK